MAFDEPDEWAKIGILSDSGVPLAKRSRVMIWDEIVNQTIFGPFKVFEGIKLNCACHYDFLDKLF